jgi:hypothetical protein
VATELAGRTQVGYQGPLGQHESTWDPPYSREEQEGRWCLVQANLVVWKDLDITWAVLRPCPKAENQCSATVAAFSLSNWLKRCKQNCHSRR